MRTIYLLKLENSRYFIFARESDPRLSTVYLFLEATLKYDYLKTHKPMSVLKEWTETHPIDLDTQVKKHMILYGIQNVRGGSYTTDELTPAQLSILETELQGQPNTPPDSVIKEIIDTYANVPLSKTEIKKEKAKLKSGYTKWKKEIEHHTEIWIDVNSARDKIAWIREVCQKQTKAFEEGKRETILYTLENKVDIVKYRQIINIFSRIYHIFNKIYNKPYTKSLDLPLKHPEFLLDDFIYHWNRIHLSEELKKVERLCDEYSFFVTFIENRIAEAEFDIYSWAEHAQWRFPCALFLLDNYLS